MKVLLMYFTLLFLIFYTLAGCSSKKTMLNTEQEFLEFNNEFCEDYIDKVKKRKIFACSSGDSANFELSQSKAILNAQTSLANIVNSTINKDETYSERETNQGVVKEYAKFSQVQINDANVNNYRVLKMQTVKHNSKWRTFVVLQYKYN